MLSLSTTQASYINFSSATRIELCGIVSLGLTGTTNVEGATLTQGNVSEACGKLIDTTLPFTVIRPTSSRTNTKYDIYQAPYDSSTDYTKLTPFIEITQDLDDGTVFVRLPDYMAENKTYKLTQAMVVSISDGSTIQGKSY